MKRDKITIAYILITITIIVFASIYFIKLDFKESNTNIKKGAKQAFNTGKIYSDKMYTMLNGYAADFMSDDKNVTDLKVSASTVSKVTTKPVLTQRINKPEAKVKKETVSTGKLNIGNTTNKQLVKETL